MLLAIGAVALLCDIYHMMRPFILSLVLLASSASLFAQGAAINWISVNDLEAAQAKEPRKVMIDVYTKWCGPCKMMMRNTFTNGDVISYINEHYYAVKFDAEGPDPVEFKGKTFSNPSYVPNKPGRNGVHELSRAFQVRAYPTIVYLDEGVGNDRSGQWIQEPAAVGAVPPVLRRCMGPRNFSGRMGHIPTVLYPHF